MSERYLAGQGSASFTPSDFQTGENPLRTITITVAQSAALESYSVLGFVTATDKALLSDETAADGSEIAQCILVHGVDATGGDVEAVAYVEGHVNPELLVFGGNQTAVTTKASLRANGIYLQAPA